MDHRCFIIRKVPSGLMWCSGRIPWKPSVGLPHKLRMVKSHTQVQGMQVDPWVRKVPSGRRANLSILLENADRRLAGLWIIGE